MGPVPDEKTQPSTEAPSVPVGHGQPSSQPRTPETQDEAPAPSHWSVADGQKVEADKLNVDLYFFTEGGRPHLRIVPRGDQHGTWHGVFGRDGRFVGEDVGN